MRYYAIPPVGRLAEFVSRYWVSEFDAEKQDVFTWISTADSCAKLVFIYAAGTLASSGMQGQTQTHGRFPTHGRFGIFGVTLFSHAIPHLFGMPASEISDQMLDLHLLLGRKGQELNERMAAATGTPERLTIINTFLEQQLTQHYMPETVITRAIKEIRARKGLIDVDTLAAQCHLSRKQFERKCKEWSGFMPKRYARIIRFEAALHSYTGDTLLTGIAHEYGYYDQSHFIRDFKAFTGLPPAQYFSATAL